MARVTTSRQTIRRRAVIVEKRQIARPEPVHEMHKLAAPPAVGRIAAEVARFRMRGKDRFPLEWLAGTI
jgi:hypothetical protein